MRKAFLRSLNNASKPIRCSCNTRKLRVSTSPTLHLSVSSHSDSILQQSNKHLSHVTVLASLESMKDNHICIFYCLANVLRRSDILSKYTSEKWMLFSLQRCAKNMYLFQLCVLMQVNKQRAQSYIWVGLGLFGDTAWGTMEAPACPRQCKLWYADMYIVES